MLRETVYAVLALSEFDRLRYLGQIRAAGIYLHNAQLVTGGWENYPGSDYEENSITGEVLRGITVSVCLSTVPDVVDQTEADANSTITAAGLVVGTMTYEYSDIIPDGLVISQDPNGGTEVYIGSYVDLVISLGQPAVPYVVGMTEAEANSTITAHSLVVGTVIYEYSETVAVGIVISQSPDSGTIVTTGTPVDIAVSLGQPAVVPNVVDQTAADANSAITAAGLIVGTITYEYSDTITAGFVISQNPAADTQVPIGSPVDFVVSSGQPVVPDVVWMTEPNATAAITAVDNLTVGTVTYEYSDTVAVGLVISQNPVGYTSVPIGSFVDLFVSLGQAVTVPYVVDQTEANANSAITAAGLIIGIVTYDYNEIVTAGHIISQNPAGGLTVPIGSSVDLVVSGANVPDIVGQTEAYANSAITAAGLVIGIVTYDYNDTVTAGLVISQNPDRGTAAPIGSSVDFVVSLGQPTV
jgi:beta-lactam-binding protein with PASTA domain